MPALLYCKTGQLTGSSFTLDLEATIGRTDSNTIALGDERVSTHHARIFFDDKADCYLLEDLGSRNGTEIDGLEVKESVKLGALNVITFARSFDFIFQTVSAGTDAPAAVTSEEPDNTTRIGGSIPTLPGVESDASEIESELQTRVGGASPALPKFDDPGDPGEDASQTRIGGAAPDLPSFGAPDVQAGGTDADAEREVVADQESDGEAGAEQTRIGAGAPMVLPDLPVSPVSEETGEPAPAAAYVLTVHGFDSPEATFHLVEGENTIGRSPDCEVPIDDVSLSRRHAVITVTSGSVSITDLDSKNGTFVDNTAIKKLTTILPENRIRFGFRVEALLAKK